MSLSFVQLQHILRRHVEAMVQLETLYAEMDACYATAAARHGFECRGCEDSCCRTLFYHHTLVEVAGLFAGYLKLTAEQKGFVSRRAQDHRRSLHSDGYHRPFRHLCPLNQESRCLLYRERPMICRLHGIPHVLRHPVKGLISGPGCHAFEASFGPTAGQALDRTPHYAAMAHLEKSLRQASVIETPVRLTIAQMIGCFEPPPNPAIRPGPPMCKEMRREQ